MNLISQKSFNQSPAILDVFFTHTMDTNISFSVRSCLNTEKKMIVSESNHTVFVICFAVKSHKAVDKRLMIVIMWVWFICRKHGTVHNIQSIYDKTTMERIHYILTTQSEEYNWKEFQVINAYNIDKASLNILAFMSGCLLSIMHNLWCGKTLEIKHLKLTS